MYIFYYFLLISLIFSIVDGLKVSVFGASGGIGQQICRALKADGFSVTAVSRNVDKLAGFELLSGCEFCQADARMKETIPPAIDGANTVIISVGTTAFPTAKWKDGNDPKAACFDTVANIVDCIEEMQQKPENVILLSSIGAERVDEMPFKLLNSYGVLDEKRKSELLLMEKSKSLFFRAIVCRPGRLVGEPFTNFDLAKLFNIDQGKNQGIVIDTRDVLNGDVERYDVAGSVVRLLKEPLSANKEPIVYSIINKEGPPPSEMQWTRMLSLFSVPKVDLLTTRSS